MPTLKKMIDDLHLTLNKSKPTPESRITKRQLKYKIAQYRAIGIRQTYQRNKYIHPIWVQDFGEFRFTKVNSGDDPNVSNCNCILAKAFLPTWINLGHNNTGIIRVSSTCKTKEYYPTTLDRFQYFVQDSIRSKFNYYFSVGNALYLFPFIKDGNIQAILEDPLEGQILLTHVVASGDIEKGKQYKVSAGSVTYDSVSYTTGQTFTGTKVTTYTGNGQVSFESKKRKLIDTDPYPVDHTLLEFINMKILGQELNIESQKIADVRSDSQDEQVRIEQR